VKVNETFYSLQGEGARAGEASLFIRLSGCDLACGFCDTEFASGSQMTDQELLDIAHNSGTRWIVWTGGEPALQLTQETVDTFRAAGFKQSIETNGGHPVPSMDWVVVSPKVAEHVLAKNHPGGVDELRYAWHKGKQSVPEPSIVARHQYISPICDGNNINHENLAHCVLLCQKHPSWKLSLQQHKLWNIL
jgi:7-carboxy-7-deazaguanine synthase